jgi:hypothetical protein
MKTSQDQVKEDLDNSIDKLKDMLQDENTTATDSDASNSSMPVEDTTMDENKPDESVIAGAQQVTDSAGNEAPVKKKKKKRRKKKKIEEEGATESETKTVAPVVQAVAEPPSKVIADQTPPEESTLGTTSIPLTSDVVVEVDLETDSVPETMLLLPDESSLELAPISMSEDLTTVSPFEIPETLLMEEPAGECPSTPVAEVDSSVGAIETVIESALVSDPIAESLEDKPDEADLIMDALKSLDYEPVLSDTVLDLLVGKAANREKAVIATISRLENAMAAVVNEVQAALEHHNKTSALVTLAKLNAQSISEATSKEAAKELLERLLQASADVRDAFDEGEVINTRVTGAFNKLSEIADKAEQFDLKGKLHS